MAGKLNRAFRAGRRAQAGRGLQISQGFPLAGAHRLDDVLEFHGGGMDRFFDGDRGGLVQQGCEAQKVRGDSEGKVFGDYHKGPMAGKGSHQKPDFEDEVVSQRIGGVRSGADSFVVWGDQCREIGNPQLCFQVFDWESL